MKSHKTTELRSVLPLFYHQFGDHILTNGRAHDAYENTLNLAPYCQIQKKIPRDIAASIDKIVLTGKTETSSSSTEGNLGKETRILQPDLETVCTKQILIVL